jgi:glycosyltransferase involved in cell wall biosynthesis
MKIMGDGEERPNLLEDIARNGLTGVVRVLPWGTPAEVQLLLREADLLLLPSNVEGMPIVVMEALALGCAVVASRVSGIEDYEDHALAPGCFWVYTVGDVSAAATAIQRAQEVEAAVRRARARAFAETEFSIARCVERYTSFIRELSPSMRLQPSLIERHPVLRSLVSVPVAAQRVARLWARGRYNRPAPVALNE